MRCAVAGLLALLLAACADSSTPVAAGGGASSSGGGSSSGGTTPPNPASLCVSNSCGTQRTLLTIPDAENIQFSDDGRLFVSGGTNVFEITRSGQTFSAKPLIAAGCNATGLAIRANTLYANCFNGMLHAAPLAASAATQALLQPIHNLGVTSANGLVDGPDNTLYVVNGPITQTPIVIKLTLDPADPLKVNTQATWLATGLQAPNGIQRRGNTLVIMNSNPLAAQGTQLIAVDIQPNGSAGTPRTIATLTPVGDDFTITGDHYLVVDYGTGGATLLGPDGSTRQSIMAATFESPSHIEVTRGPLFKPGQLLVTEKGVIGDNTSSNGNVLTLFHPSSDSAPLPP